MSSIQKRASFEISSFFPGCRSFFSVEIAKSPLLSSSISIQTTAVVASRMQIVSFLFSSRVPEETCFCTLDQLGSILSADLVMTNSTVGVCHHKICREYAS